MNKLFPFLGLLFLPLPVLAGGLSASELQCLSRVREESNFIVSRINLVHREYEKQLKDSGLGGFKSGNYSTGTLLNNTIRKYHRSLVHRIQSYPIKYETRLRGTQHPGGGVCLARQLHEQAVGTIHEFELSWERALADARTNAEYFRHLDGIR
jgi:hypothetical protein